LGIKSQAMFGKVKKWLGIEGVKLEILIQEEEIPARRGIVYGTLRFQSMNTQTVTGIKMTLTERYSRGRGQEKLIDEYLLGSIEMNEAFEVPADEVVEIEFSLPFQLVQSDMDRFGRRNFLFGGVASAAKYIQGAKSEFRIEAEAEVKGVALNPFDRKVVRIK
jgi:hypothetical protein